MENIIVILKAIFDFLHGLFIKEDKQEIKITSFENHELKTVNKNHIKKFSGKNRYVKCPSLE